MNRFNAHCWRCQPTADVCNTTERIATELIATTEAWSATTETSNETDAEHRLVLQPIETRYTVQLNAILTHPVLTHIFSGKSASKVFEKVPF